jgi:hypothetical protein
MGPSRSSPKQIMEIGNKSILGSEIGLRMAPVFHGGKDKTKKIHTIQTIALG